MESDSAGFYRALFGPVVSLVTSDDADEVIGRNGRLRLDELLRPFSAVQTDLTSRDSSGQLHPVSKMRVNFKRLGCVTPTEEELNGRLLAAVEQNVTPGPERVRLDSGAYCLNVSAGCPWFSHFREIYLSNAPVEPHERLNHYMATLFCVSSENPDPMDQFRKLSDLNRIERKRLSELKENSEHFWFSDSTQILFLLVHDTQKGSEAKAQEVHANLKQTFGESCSFLLRVNSQAAGDGPDPWNGILARQDPLRSPVKEILCGHRDQESIRGFIKELMVKGLIPHMEREGYKLAEIIQNRKALHRSLFSATRKLFGTGGSKSSQMSEKYAESVEVQIRKLADLQFLLQQYHKASENYAYAKRELSNDQNWVEATSAAEMSAIAAFMAHGARENFPRQVSAHAINSYMNCNKPALAVKCALVTLEAVRAAGGYIDAAKDFLKFVSNQNALLVALFTEQAALCYLKAQFPRQFAFQSVLAGHQFKVAGQRKHSIRNYLNAEEVIKGRGWKQAELHINEIIGVHALHLGDSAKAAQQFDSALALTVGQNPSTLQNYLRTMATNKGVCATRYPKIEMQLIQLEVGSVQQNGLTFEKSLLERHIHRVRELEVECARAASDGIIPIKYKESYPSHRRGPFMPNQRSISCSVDETLQIKVPIFNQLLNTLLISDVELLHTGDVECKIHRVDENSVMLDSKVSHELVFRVSPLGPGELTFTGIKYRLTTPDVENAETIELEQSFEIIGHRLTKTSQHKKSKMYDADRRLSVVVVEKCARLEVSVRQPPPETCLSGEAVTFDLIVANTGNGDANDVWLNHNQGHLLTVNSLKCVMEESVCTLSKSSLPGPTNLGLIKSKEEKVFPVKALMGGDTGKWLCELVVYTELHGENNHYQPQADAVVLESEIVAPIRFSINPLPAPIKCHKRALQVGVRTEPSDSGATCRYQLVECVSLGEWRLGGEERQPALGMKWIQGQRAQSLLFVQQGQSLPHNVKETVEGKRAWRRVMSRDAPVSFGGAENELFAQFAQLSLDDFSVPEPTPEDDVVDHWWVESLAARRTTDVALLWRAEVVAQTGLRHALGLHWVHLGNLEQMESNSDPMPVACYVEASHRLCHDFKTGPARVSAIVRVENVTAHTNVDCVVSFQAMLDSAAGLGECSFVWSGISEKKLALAPSKKVEVKNVAIFARPGTFDLGNFEISIGDIKVKPRTHMIVINDS